MDGKKYLIKNTTIEQMFMDCADDYSKYQFMKLVEDNVNGKGIALATAYASRIVKAKFDTLLELEDSLMRDEVMVDVNANRKADYIEINGSF